MDVKDAYPLVVVADPQQLRDLYVRHLGFSVGFEADWVVHLTSPGARPFGVCFMREGLHHQLPQFRTRIGGDAVVLTLEVDDAAEALGEVEATGAVPVMTWRSLAFRPRYSTATSIWRSGDHPSPGASSAISSWRSAPRWPRYVTTSSRHRSSGSDQGKTASRSSA